MKDSRVTVWTNPTALTADGTYNGPTIDLLSNVVVGQPTNQLPFGNMAEGLGVQILITDIVATAWNLQIKWQTSDDGSTWEDSGFITPRGGIDPANVVGNKIVLESTLPRNASRRYARLVAITASMSAESANMYAYVEDGVKTGVENEVRYA